MPYNKTNWQNEPSTATPLSAANLNKLETQYDAVVADIEDSSTALGSALSTKIVSLAVAARTSDGHPLPAGTIVVLTLDKTLAQITATPTAEIADITFEGVE